MAATKKKAKSLAATETFTTWHQDEEGHPVEVTVIEGDKLPTDHPIVEGHRELFEAA